MYHWIEKKIPQSTRVSRPDRWRLTDNKSFYINDLKQKRGIFIGNLGISGIIKNIYFAK